MTVFTFSNIKQKLYGLLLKSYRLDVKNDIYKKVAWLVFLPPFLLKQSITNTTAHILGISYLLKGKNILPQEARKQNLILSEIKQSPQVAKDYFIKPRKRFLQFGTAILCLFFYAITNIIYLKALPKHILHVPSYALMINCVILGVSVLTIIILLFFILRCHALKIECLKTCINSTHNEGDKNFSAVPIGHCGETIEIIQTTRKDLEQIEGSMSKKKSNIYTALFFFSIIVLGISISIVLKNFLYSNLFSNEVFIGVNTVLVTLSIASAVIAVCLYIKLIPASLFENCLNYEMDPCENPTLASETEPISVYAIPQNSLNSQAPTACQNQINIQLGNNVTPPDPNQADSSGPDFTVKRILPSRNLESLIAAISIVEEKVDATQLSH